MVIEQDVLANDEDEADRLFQDSGINHEKINTELTEEMKQAQYQKYFDLVNMYSQIVPKDQQYGITFWGFNDRDTWIRRFFKMTDWPCIYDDDLEPKPAFFGFLDALKVNAN